MGRIYRIVKETKSDNTVMFFTQYKYCWIDSWKLLPKGIHNTQKEAEDEVNKWKNWDNKAHIKHKKEVIV